MRSLRYLMASVSVASVLAFGPAMANDMGGGYGGGGYGGGGYGGGGFNPQVDVLGVIDAVAGAAAAAAANQRVYHPTSPWSGFYPPVAEHRITFRGPCGQWAKAEAAYRRRGEAQRAWRAHYLYQRCLEAY